MGEGRPFRAALHDDFKRLLGKAGLLDMRFHDLRHSAASLMLAQGIPLHSIQDILGHKLHRPHRESLRAHRRAA